jgi:hypothetical protein
MWNSNRGGEIMDKRFFKVLSDGVTLVEHPGGQIVTDKVCIDNPTEPIFNKFGYYLKEEFEEEHPQEEEGYKVFDDGYVVINDTDAEGVVHKVLHRQYRKLKIIDDGMPEVGENQEFISDEWVETETEYKHVYHVVNIEDNPPALEEGQVVWGEPEWVIDLEHDVKYKRYNTRFIVDNPPELPEGHSFVDDYWDDDGVTRTHIYPMTAIVVDNKPELQEGQQIVDSHYEDTFDENGVMTRTFYYEVRTIVDNPPELEEGQQITNDYWDDDDTTRTHIYEVRKVVDEMPTLEDNQFIADEYWHDDGTTLTRVFNVWTRIDEKPTYDEETQRLIDTEEWAEFPEEKCVRRRYIVKDIVDVRPEDDPEGNYYFVEDGEEETETQIIKKYKRVEKVWRVFSKLSLEMALFGIGKLDAFDAFIDALAIPNEHGQTVPLRRFYNQANDLKENHKLFKPFYAQALAALELTFEQGEELLQKCVVEA